MENKRYSEDDLLEPALFEIYRNGGKLKTSELIKILTEVLNPQGEDSEILFGRNDTRFSQKVRNLISHKKIYPKYADYDKEKSLLTINDYGKAKLLESEYYCKNSNNDDFYVKDGIGYDDVEPKEEDEDFQPKEEDEDFEPRDESDNFESIVRKHVECEPVNYSVYELKRKYDKKKENITTGIIILDDSFQRNNVWSRKQKSQLIESLILGIPIPYLYVYEGKKSNLIVIDGRQRLSAIFDYLDNKYLLSGLEFLKSLERKKAKDLVGDLEKYKAKLEDAHLHVVKVGYETSEIFKLKIFQRVNQGGTKLNNQELRHALHQGVITETLKELSDGLEILSSDAKKRMKDRYLILRYISMRLYMLGELKYYGSNTKNNFVEYTEINTFLANSMDAINTFSEEQILNIKIDFLNNYKDALIVLGDNAFKLEPTSPVNMILFEVTLLFMSLINKYNIPKVTLKEMIEDFKNIDKENVDEDGNTPFFQNIKYHRDSKNNFVQRLDWIKKIISKYKG